MDGLNLLRLAAASAEGHVPEDAMPREALRFVPEYSGEPDIAAERDKVALLLERQVFSLRPMDAEPGTSLRRFLVLQIPLPAVRLSSHARYEMANALAAGLGLVSCEPDVDARVYAEPDARDLELSHPESAIVDLWCTSKATPPLDRRWALAAIRAPAAWRISPDKGKGILVGQPDTGVAAHPELEAGALALDKAANIIDGTRDPTDPLSPDFANPGHGTATSSVVISREAGIMTGAAPGARVVPIRCVNDVKIFNGAPVAAAVTHARKAGCDVVSMSLGGIPSSALAAAIRDAVNDGMIVIAAAGNCVGFVVHPAADGNVIAVAGTDEHDRPWKGTSAGSAVDIAAPGENVYVARRKPGDGGHAEVSGGQGTSFATALTAGAAALWLAHHGRAAVCAEAARRQVTVQALFRSALRHTARVPAGWNADDYGAGILDTEALLRLKLANIPSSVSARASSGGFVTEIARLADARRTVDGFDWARHGAEAMFLAARAEIASRRTRAGMETVGTGILRPSAALEATAPPVLRRLFGAIAIEGREPSPVVIRPATPNERLLKLAGKYAGGGAESAAGLSVEAARQRIGGAHGAELIGKMEQVFQQLQPGDAAIGRERDRAVESAASGLRKLAAEGLGASLSVHERVGIEALINIHDRPALRVRDGGIGEDDPLAGDWTGRLLPARELIAPVAAAVGRIDLGGSHVGTGFVIAPGRVMTNRHVLEAIAEEFPRSGGTSRWVLTGDATINFAESGRGVGTAFSIRDVIAAGPDRIDETVDFAHLDMAVLEVETMNGAGAALPKAIDLATDGTLAAERSQFIVIGYPAPPGRNALVDPDTGLIRNDIVARLGQIFGVAYSRKYLSPGEIDFPVGTLAGDARRWIFAHDATTLGGNSGSCIVHLGEPFGVIGLHFGGGTLRANYAHGLAAVRSAGILPATALDGIAWV